jgi:arylsulfatase A-like enzyme
MKNVVLLTIDCLRKDVLGCYGNQDGLTPFLDSIAQKSIQFTKAQTVAPYTQASFPGILTSSYYFDHAKEEKRTEMLSRKRTLLSEVLRQAGITTAAFHSNPYLGDYFGWNRGWDRFYDSMEEDVSPISPFSKGDAINQMVDKWLSHHVSGSDDKPFFLWTHYMDVHEPYIPHKEYLDAVDSSIDLSKEEMLELFEEVVLKRDVSNAETVNLLRKLYLAVVREADDHTRTFFDVLEKHGVLDGSVVMITTDHGDEFGEHGSLSHNGKMYSELIDSPLLIYNYSTGEAQICDTLVSGLDISPTIAHLFKLEPVENFQGHSLLPLEDYPQKGCYGEAIGKLGHRVKDTDKPVYFHRENDLKIIYRVEEDSWEMYDLQADPEEQNNIIDTSPLSEEMKSRLTPRINREPNIP